MEKIVAMPIVGIIGIISWIAFFFTAGRPDSAGCYEFRPKWGYWLVRALEFLWIASSVLFKVLLALGYPTPSIALISIICFAFFLVTLSFVKIIEQAYWSRSKDRIAFISICVALGIDMFAI